MTNPQTIKQSFEQRLKRQGITSKLQDDEEQRYLSKFRNLPFWLWDIDRHQREFSRTCGRCCWQHVAGLPSKNNQPRPLYPFQKELISALQSDDKKLIAVVKARGTGLSEIACRFMCYLCTRDNAMQNKNVVILTGIRENLSEELLHRFRNLLPDYPWDKIEGNNATTAVLNKCRIFGMPSKRVKDLRGLSDVKFVFIDEIDHLDESDAREILPITESLRVKADTKILIGSTPGRLGSVLHSLYLEPEQTCRYHRIYIPYQAALGSLLSQEEIEEAKRMGEWGFSHEFELKWGFGTPGNLFSPLDIQKAIDLGKKVEDPYRVIPSAPQFIGVDPGAADSAFSICMTQMYDRRVYVCVQENHHRPNEDHMIDRILLLLESADYKANVFVDAANQSFIKRLKQRVAHNEISDWEWHSNYLKENKVQPSEWVNHMIVVPVSFNVHGPRLLQTLHAYIQRNLIAIHPDFTELIQALQSARLQEKASHMWALDKTSYSLDALDSLRLTMHDFLVPQERKKQR